MYRQIIIPTTKEHSIELPENLYGKQVEITVKEIKTKSNKRPRTKKLPASLKNDPFWNDVPFNIDFPSLKEIRATAWPARNW